MVTILENETTGLAKKPNLVVSFYCCSVFQFANKPFITNGIIILSIDAFHKQTNDYLLYLNTPYYIYRYRNGLQWIAIEVEEDGGEIAFTGVGEEDHYLLAFVFRTLRHLCGSESGGSGRDSHEQAFGLG